MDHADVVHPRALEKVTMTDEQGLKVLLSKVTRLEVIGKGREYIVGDMYGDPIHSIDISLQDDGRTLKIFVSRVALPLGERSGDRTDDYTNSTAA